MHQFARGQQNFAKRENVAGERGHLFEDFVVHISEQFHLDLLDGFTETKQDFAIAGDEIVCDFVNQESGRFAELEKVLVISPIDVRDYPNVAATGWSSTLQDVSLITSLGGEPARGSRFNK